MRIAQYNKFRLNYTPGLKDIEDYFMETIQMDMKQLGIAFNEVGDRPIKPSGEDMGLVISRYDTKHVRKQQPVAKDFTYNIAQNYEYDYLGYFQDILNDIKKESNKKNMLPGGFK
jgi:hypothetical protein